MSARTLDRQDNTAHRPWPASPTQYPLTGKTTGPVYCPPAPKPWAVALAHRILHGVWE
jgi:hypothetical protein